MAGRPPKALVDQFVQDTHRLVTHELAQKYGKALSTIKEWRAWCARNGHVVGYGPIPQGKAHVYDDWVRRTGDAMVVGDLEIPYHDAELLGYLVLVARRFQIRRLILNGDVMAFDWLSTWPVEAGQYDTTDVDEFGAARKAMKALQSSFDEIIITKGNHEQRATRMGISVQLILMALGVDPEKVVFSHYMFCELESAGRTWLIVHPQNHSIIRGRVPADLATVEDCHVMSSHTHYGGISFSPNGKYHAIDIGHCTRPETRHYVMHGKRKSPKWVAGFGMIYRGYGYALYKDFTDWDFWLGENK